MGETNKPASDTDEEASAPSQEIDLPPSDPGESDSGEAGMDLDQDFILIHRATSSTDYDDMDRIHSSAAKLARARGRGEFPLINESLTSGSQSQSEETYLVRFNRGKINVETGYVMRFVDPEQRQFSVFDICSIPEVPSFPVPESALESLPLGLRGILEDQGYLRIQGEYDSDLQEFVDVMLGWEIQSGDSLDDLMQIIKVMDGRLAPSLSYVVYAYGPERWQDPGVIAEARGIEESTVREQIEAAKEELPERFRSSDS